jgi:predicted ATPase
MEEFDKDILADLFKNIDETVSKDIAETEAELEKYIQTVNKLLSEVEKRLKFAEEEGDEALYNLELNRKQLVLQKLNELESVRKR